MADLISFDIDGTLEMGDPRGSVTIEMVRRVKEKGNLVGSCSDRPVSYQRLLWELHNVEVPITGEDMLDRTGLSFPSRWPIV